MKATLNLQDLMSMMGGDEISPEQKRLNEVRAKLLDNTAIEEWHKVIDTIHSLVGDVRGRVEAIAFCKVYLKRFINMANESAKDSGLPVEIAAILAYHLIPMTSFAITDRYNQICDNTEFLDKLAKETEQKAVLTPEEVDALEAEKVALEAIVEAQKEEEKIHNVYDECDNSNPDQSEPGYGEQYGQLDPKNPFGLN